MTKIKKNNKIVGLKVFDTPGQVRYRSYILSMIERSDVQIIVFDLTEKTTFENLPKWLESISSNQNLCAILIGNKADDVSFREVDKETIKNFCTSNSLYYLETSAKQNININEIFDYCVHIYFKNHPNVFQGEKLKNNKNNSKALLKKEKNTYKRKNTCC